MSMFSLSFNTNNDVFAGNPNPAIANILEDIAKKVDDNKTSGVIRDNNGNSIGNYVYSRDRSIR